MNQALPTSRPTWTASLDRWLLPAVFLLACLLYLKADFFVSWDLSRYLEMARGLTLGQGLAYIDGAPLTERQLLPLILAGVLWISNGSMLACTLAVSLISACFPLLVSALARRLFGLRAALATAGLVLFSPALIFWAPRHLDALWPLPLLACLVLLAARPRSVEAWPGLACGLLAGLALLGKETAILFAPVPLLAWLCRLLPGGRRRVGWFYLSYLPVLMAVGWLFFSSGAANQNPAAFGDASLVGILRLGLLGLGRYLGVVDGSSLGSTFGLAPLLLAAVLAAPLVLRHSGRPAAARQAGLLLLVFLCFLPASIYPAYFSWRLSQNLLGVALMYITLGGLLAWSAGRLAEKLGRPGRAPLAAGLILAAFVAGGIFWQVLADAPLARVVYRNTLAMAAARLKSPRLTLRGKTIYKWLRENHPQPCAVLVDYPPVRYGLGLFNQGRYLAMHLPLRSMAPIARGVHALGLIPLAGRRAGPVMIYCYPQPSRAMAETTIYFLFADELWRVLQSGRAGYLALYYKSFQATMALWAQGDPGLVQSLSQARATGKQRLDLYQIRAGRLRGPAPRAPSVTVNRHAAAYLRWLSQKRPQAWARMRRDMLRSVEALTPQMIEALLQKRSNKGLIII